MLRGHQHSRRLWCTPRVELCLIVLWWVTVALGCSSSDEQRACQSDSDCRGGESCESTGWLGSGGSGVCVAESAADDAGDTTDRDAEDVATLRDVPEDTRAGPADAEADVPDSDDVEEDDPRPQSDPDEDGVITVNDNCPNEYNPEQADADRDFLGDACDACEDVASVPQGSECDYPAWWDERYGDADADGIPNRRDNCPDVANPPQQDRDSDGFGDLCDNCPDESNPTQPDTDGDGIGDGCESSPQAAGDLQLCHDESFTYTAPRPDVYFVVDTSDTMNATVLGWVREDLEGIATLLSDQANVGLMDAGASTCSDATELVDVTPGDASGDFAGAVDQLQAVGERPTAGALEMILSNSLYAVDQDSATHRRHVVMLVTDGTPDACGGATRARTAAAQLAGAGVPVYVFGMDLSPGHSELELLAASGGTGRAHYPNRVQRLDELATGIIGDEISCSIPLDSEMIVSSQIWVTLDGEPVPHDSADGYVIDTDTGSLQIRGSYCRTWKGASGADPIDVTVQAACSHGCTTDESNWHWRCDGRDNDCDGVIDERCQSDQCQPEVCDETDNDCGGLTDEGCPDCAYPGRTCELDEDCCIGVCDRGTCQDACGRDGAACRRDGDCCYGFCMSGGDGVGVCLSD